MLLSARKLIKIKKSNIHRGNLHQLAYTYTLTNAREARYMCMQVGVNFHDEYFTFYKFSGAQKWIKVNKRDAKRIPAGEVPTPPVSAE